MCYIPLNVLSFRWESLQTFYTSSILWPSSKQSNIVLWLPVLSCDVVRLLNGCCMQDRLILSQHGGKKTCIMVQLELTTILIPAFFCQFSILVRINAAVILFAVEILTTSTWCGHFWQKKNNMTRPSCTCNVVIVCCYNTILMSPAIQKKLVRFKTTTFCCI